MKRPLFGLRPGRGGRAAPLDPPAGYVTVREQTVVRVGLACAVVGMAFGIILAAMLMTGPC